jgi:signal transduction histidine kinase
MLANRIANSHLYRIAQEAVSNSIRHGKANRVEISLTSAKGEIVLKIRDNGTGLPRHLGKRQGMGLRIMNHRAGTIGASLVVRRRASGGTEVVCIMPQGSRDPFEANP